MEKCHACFVFLLAMLYLAGTTKGIPPKPNAFFVFGDSYVDTGNLFDNSTSWKFPYGVTWPGHATGRFGNGHIQTDFLANDLLESAGVLRLLIDGQVTSLLGLSLVLEESGSEEMESSPGIIPWTDGRRDDRRMDKCIDAAGALCTYRWKRGNTDADSFMTRIIRCIGAFADKLGLPSPTLSSNAANQSIATGVNFAFGGSGVTYAFGAPPLHFQVDQFELLLQSGAYSPSFLAGSLTLVSNEGNDYNFNYSNLEYPVVIREVIEGMTVALKRLYDLGLRNILVANLPPINCLPQSTVESNYTSCQSLPFPLILAHNNRLLEAVENLNALPDANFLIIDEWEAFTYVLNNTKLYGIKERFVPCCRPITPADYCGDVDGQGNPRYTLCNDPMSFVFWDTQHPAESMWKHVVDLYYNKTGFVIGATTLESWLYQNGLRSPAPVPGPSVPEGGAAGELAKAYQTLISELDYAESLGLLQAIDWDQYLDEIPDQTVTVFLPNNFAYYSTPDSTIAKIYAQDDVVPVVKFHVTKGYYDSFQLSASIQNLTTISRADLLVTPISNAILVGPMNATIIRPDLYKVEGQVVIHGINKILIPPDLRFM